MLSWLKLLTVPLMAIINRHRGGGWPNIELGRKLWTAGLFIIPIIYWLADFIAEPNQRLLYAAITAITWVVWGVKGWGSYFDLGKNARGYRDAYEVGWIDSILYLIFGPKWSPEVKYVRPRWTWSWKNLLKSPETLGWLPPDVKMDTTYRPIAWRRRRDIVGMFLRGLYTLPFFSYQAWVLGDVWLVTLTPLWAALFCGCYLVGHWVWNNKKNIQDKLSWSIIEKFYKYITDHGRMILVAEWLVGILWAATFLAIMGI